MAQEVAQEEGTTAAIEDVDVSIAEQKINDAAEEITELI